MDVALIRRKLIRWYRRAQRDLPWRRTRDPYAIWVSEIMLQQTRVAAVVPYYERFLTRFPDPAALANAPESEVLRMWAGLGYYSRARSLHKAARQIVERGEFPRGRDSIRELAGVGDYTAAAVASIAFGLPHAAVDGNVRRVLVRLTNNDEVDVERQASLLLDRRDPGRWNQAVMELGALVCLPREPRCGECPVAAHCQARMHGTQGDLPARRAKPSAIHLRRTLLVIRRRGRILLTPSSRVRGFWDLPEPFDGARVAEKLGEFAHTITHRRYQFAVRAGIVRRIVNTCAWFPSKNLHEIPLSTTAKKALRCLDRYEQGG
jgi:A/G-specific adenine glycosylase